MNFRFAEEQDVDLILYFVRELISPDCKSTWLWQNGVIMEMDWLFETDGCMCELRTTGVLIKDGKVLVQQELSGSEQEYALPGGHVRFGETLEDALIREYQEELGVDIRCKKLLWTEECFYSWKGKRYHNLAFYFLIDLCDGFDIPDTEAFVPCNDNKNILIGWKSIEEMKKPYIIFYPEFFKTEVDRMDESMKHFVTYT